MLADQMSGQVCQLPRGHAVFGVGQARRVAELAALQADPLGFLGHQLGEGGFVARHGLGDRNGRIVARLDDDAL